MSARRPRSSPATSSTPRTIRAALDGVHTVYYLVHSMSSSRQFDEVDREAARAFVAAAQDAGVRKIVYLGGLGHGDGLSGHLRSRQEVGEILRASGVPTIELRASIVIGSGSASFEMVRALVEKLPGDGDAEMGACEGAADRDRGRRRYLVAALDHEPQGGELYEIGGADRVTYLELMQEYGRQRGLRRMMIPVPVLSPRLSSLLALARDPGLRRRRAQARRLAPQRDRRLRRPARSRCFPCGRERRGEAIGRALANEDREMAETRFSDEAFAERSAYGGVRVGSRLVDTRVRGGAPSHRRVAFAPIQRIGGRDRLVQGRRSSGGCEDCSTSLRAGPGSAGAAGIRRSCGSGDTIDFWRVEAFEQDRLLRLRAEMKVPGRAWLQFEVQTAGGRVSRDPDRDLRAGRPLRARLLVRPLALPRLHLRRHAAEPRSGDGRSRRAGGRPALTAHIRHEDDTHPSTGAPLPSRHGGGTERSRTVRPNRVHATGERGAGRAARGAPGPSPRGGGVGAGGRR